MNMPILTQTIQVADKQTSLIQYKSVPVMTTEQLAGFYGTDPVNIRKNHMRNAERFIDGKHFFKVEGDELRTLKNSLSDFEVLSPNTRSLTLWTEKGAARHAKILDTDQAWDVYEQLEEVYFAVREKSHFPALPNFADPAEAAIAWANEYKAKQLAIQERDHAIATSSQDFNQLQNTVENLQYQISLLTRKGKQKVQIVDDNVIESKIKQDILRIVHANPVRGVTLREIKQNSRAVQRDLELSEKIINQLIDLEEIKLVIIPSPSGRGKPRNAYFVKGGR